MVTKARAALQTFHAIQASDLSTAFNDALRRVRLAPGDYGVEMTAPAGPSTGGGVQAMQHIRLIPQQPGLPTLVAGHANHAAEKAELRAYEHLEAVHQARFRRPLPFARQPYEDFLRLAKQILEILHLQTTVTGPPADVDLDIGSMAPPRPAKAGPSLVLVLFLVVLVLAIGAATAWKLGMLGAIGALR
jgi:hypothetical protein